MIALRAGCFFTLWATVLAVWSRAYVASVNATSLDARLAWGLPLVVVALLLGHLVTALAARRRPDNWPNLDLTGHGLCLLVAGLCVLAHAHVPVDSTVTAMREQVPPVLGFVHPLLAGLAPLLLRHRARSRDRALWLAVAVLPLSGALLLLDGPTALCIATIALLEQLARGPARLQRSPLLLASLGVMALLVLATWLGRNPMHSSNSLSWVLAGGCVMLAVGCRPRDPDDVRRLLMAPVFAALAIALCGVLLTLYLAQQVELMPALNTRLTLFRQHPNFLAPFYAFHAILAMGLTLSSTRLRALMFGVTLLLAASTWMTDSNAGKALLVIGLSGLLLLPLLRRLLGRLSRSSLRLASVGLVLIAMVGLWGLTTESGRGLFSKSLDRFEKSMDYRVDAWRNSLAVIENAPWLGVGPHTFVSERRFQPGSRFFNEPTSPHPHNVLLYVAQSAGLIALALFLAWLIPLLAQLWRGPSTPDGDPLAAPLRDALLAAVVALLLANQLDVGLALDSVVPQPLFLISGVLLALAARRDGTPVKPGHGLLWLIGAGSLFLPYGLNGVAARRQLEHARLHAYLSGPATGGTSSMAAAIASAERALELDPDLEQGYALLSRWYEQRQGGFPDAYGLLKRMSARAPSYGAAQSLLGHLYLRANMLPEAAEALTSALADEHGSVHQNRDRADTIHALTRMGRRADAFDQLVEALSQDVGVIDALNWITAAGTGKRWLAVGGQEAQPPIGLFDAVEILFGQHLATHNAQQVVGRKNWLDTYIAFRRAGSNDRAGMVLDFLEAEVPIVERHTIVHERGRMARDEGDFALALQYFEQVYEMTGNSYYEADMLAARQQLGLETDTPVAASEQVTDMAQLVEILDQPWAFAHKLEVLADLALHAEDSAAAARHLSRTLLYIDDPIKRAERWERVGDLFLSAGHHDEALQAFEQALLQLGAKPYPLEFLQIGMDRSWPARLARSMARAWRGRGEPPERVVTAAWSLSRFFSHRTSWSLFRAALFAEAGQMGALLREAQLQLLSNPDNLLARWSLVEAYEGLGQHAKVADAMRTLSEHFVDISPVVLDRLYKRAVDEGVNHMSDPEAWRKVATIEMLRGRYDESVGLYEKARELVGDDDPRLIAELAGWQARAALLTGSDQAVETVRELLTLAVAADPSCLSLRRRLETLP
jgi:O-antigen ligase